MALKIDSSKLETLFMTHYEGLFALCFLHTGTSSQAFACMRGFFYDLAMRPAVFNRASQSDTAFFREAQNACMDIYLKSPRKRRKENSSENSSDFPRLALPFSLTDPLRALINLPPSLKCPLFFQFYLSFSPEESAQVLKTSPARVQAKTGAALTRLQSTGDKVRAVLSPISLGEEAAQRTWDRIAFDLADQDFLGKRRLHRFKLGLDKSIPYIALGVVAFSALAFCAVEFGWLGSPYAKTEPLENYNPPGYSTEQKTSTPTPVLQEGRIYVPEGNDFVLYKVKDMPSSVKALSTQMVALGALPPGAGILSVHIQEGSKSYYADVEGNAPTGPTLTVTVEFNPETAPGLEGKTQLTAIAHTLLEFFGLPQELSLMCAGKELQAEDKTAAELLNQVPTVVRETATTYRP